MHPEARKLGVQATVGDVMVRDVPTVLDSASLEQIFQHLVSSAHKRVVVVDETQRVASIVADSDLISRASRENWPGIIEVLASEMPIERISHPAREHIQKMSRALGQGVYDV